MDVWDGYTVGDVVARDVTVNTRYYPRRAIWLGCTLRFNDGRRMTGMQN